MKKIFSRYVVLPVISLSLAACGGGGGGGGSSAAAEKTLTVVSAGGNGTRVASQFSDMTGVAVDGSGNVYVADTSNNTVRRISAAGVVTTLAGSAGVAGSADGTGSAARFSAPASVVVDGSGNVFVADTGNHVIRKITPAGTVTTFAGTAGVIGGLDGTGAAASFKSPQGVAVDGAGNVYVADTGNSTIRKISSSGVVSTVAGLAGALGSTDANGTSARFRQPTGLAIDGAGVVYVADFGNDTIRLIATNGDVTTLAGDAGVPGNTNATGTAAQFSQPSGVAVAGGNVYVADSGNSDIRMVTSGGVVTTFAGIDTSGSADGTGTAAAFALAQGIASGPSGTLYVADTLNFSVRKIVISSQAVSTYAGVAGFPGVADGNRLPAAFHNPLGAGLDANGNILIADTDKSVIRVVTAAGVGSVLIGIDGSAGFSDGNVLTAQFSQPQGLAFDAAGNIVLADTGNEIIRRINATPAASTVAGTPQFSGSQDGSGTTLPYAAQFTTPSAVAVDAAGNMYVADTDNNTIRKITPGGVTTTLAGSASDVADAIDGDCLAAARFWAPQGIAVDGSGNVYVADTNNNTIRKITQGGSCQVSTLAGNAADVAGFVDAAGIAARFDTPMGISVDTAGNIYVADYNNGIRKVTPAGAVTTLVTLQDSSTGNNLLPNPTDIAVRGDAAAITAGNYVFMYQ